MYIFKKVVEHEGYRLIRNDIDVKPWNLLYIASAFKSRELRRALPHWSSYTFIEEFGSFSMLPSTSTRWARHVLLSVPQN